MTSSLNVLIAVCHATDMEKMMRNNLKESIIVDEILNEFEQ